MSTPVQPISLENVLAEQANSAMARGADPAAVTGRLRTMVQYLRDNPEHAQFGADAIARGADPGTVGARVWDLAKTAGSFTEPHGAGRDFGGGEPSGGSFSASMLDAVPFGTKARAAINAAIPGGNSYEQNLLDYQAANRGYAAQHPGRAITATVAGAALPALATFGGSSGEQGASVLLKAKPTLLARIAKGAVTGAGYGALQGASQAHGSVQNYVDQIEHDAGYGAVTGGALPVVTGTLGYAANKAGLPQAVSTASQYIADRLTPGSTPNRFLARLAATTGDRGAAADLIGGRLAADQAAGSGPAVPTTPSGIAPIALDRAGPNVERLAAGIVHGTPGPGAARITGAIEGRMTQMRPSVTQAFDQGTGTTAAQGDALLTQLKGERDAIDQATAINQAVDEVRNTPVPPPAAPPALQAWRQQLGGRIGNGIEALQSAFRNRAAQARAMFGAARATTEGQAMESPTLDAIRQTPVGQQAEAWARVQKANRMRALPTVTEPSDSPTLTQLTEAGVPRDKAVAALGDGATQAETHDALDPETVHYMKQYIAKVARLGVHDGQGGTLATQAQGALGVWGQIRDELPAVWRQADDVFAEHSRVIDAINLGRNIGRVQVNPVGNKAAFQSLDAVEQQVAQMSPEEQQAFRTGGQFGLAEDFRKAPRTLVTQLRDPNSPGARKVRLVTGDPNAAAQMADRLTAGPALAQQIPGAPPIPQLSAQSRGASLGLNVLQHHVSAPGTAPERSLAVFGNAVLAMSPTEQQGVQQGAAQAFRGAFARPGVTNPGRIFLGKTLAGSASPERAAQLRYAFPSSGAMDRFTTDVNAWDELAAQRNRILGNSATASRLGEQAARAPDQTTESFVGNLMRGNIGRALGTIGKQSSVAQDVAVRRGVDKAIADILTNQNPTALQQAQRDALLRYLATNTGRRLLPRLAGSEAGASQQP